MDRKAVTYFFPDILGQAVALAQARENRQGEATPSAEEEHYLTASRLSLSVQW